MCQSLEIPFFIEDANDYKKCGLRGKSTAKKLAKLERLLKNNDVILFYLIHMHYMIYLVSITLIYIINIYILNYFRLKCG